MQKSILYGIVGLIVGLAVGFIAANSINRNSAQTVSQTPSNATTQTSQVPNILVKDQPAARGAMLPGHLRRN
jgi:uncharacterized membrane-anchored protein YhcB (DUF1043 family)